MEIRYYLDIAKRWFWMLALGAVLGCGLGYLYGKSQTPIYQASTKLLVLPAPKNETASFNYLADQQLAQTFIQLLKTQPVLDETARRLKYPVGANQIRAEIIRDTQVIAVTITSTSPQQAAEIANHIVDVLATQNDKLQSSRYVDNEQILVSQVDEMSKKINDVQEQINRLTIENVQEQIVQVQQKITGLQAEIAGLKNEISLATNQGQYPTMAPVEKTARLAQAQTTLGLYEQIYSNLLVLGKPSENQAADRVNRLQKTQDLYQEIYLQLLGNLEQVRLARLQNTPRVAQIEKAVTPTQPIWPMPAQNAFYGMFIGFALAAGVIFAIEYMDNTLRSPAEVDAILGLSVLGYISQIQNPQRQQHPYVAFQPRSPIAEAFRTLRSNIERSNAEQPPKTILVTSSRPGDGKTTVASNLASIYAQSGKRVILLDADLRRPAIHHAMGISNRLGLSTLFRENFKLEQVWKTAKNTPPSLKVITSGTLPANPAELLGSEKMLYLMADLRKNADIIIIDSPPMVVADVQIMASLVDGVILVIQPGKSIAEEAKSTFAQLKRSGAQVLGVVFNRISRWNNQQSYGGYGYYKASAYAQYYHQERPMQTIKVQPIIKPAEEARAPYRSNGHNHN